MDKRSASTTNTIIDYLPLRIDGVSRQISAAIPFHRIAAIAYLAEFGWVSQWFKCFIFKVGGNIELSGTAVIRNDGEHMTR